jgi:hypothetical protein
MALRALGVRAGAILSFRDGQLNSVTRRSKLDA